MDAPSRSAMQLSVSLLLHWRHWMRSVNDTALRFYVADDIWRFA